VVGCAPVVDEFTTAMSRCGRHVRFTQNPLQTVPQAPQLAGSLEVSCSQPSLTMPLQLPQPVAQAMLQVLLAQAGVP
jgi:hypothetical protein